MIQSKAAEISVIVPVLGEAPGIVGFVEQLCCQAQRDGVAVQLVIVDGDPQGSTLAALHEEAHADLVRLCAGPGRAAQMNAGARAASGDVLLFLHADTRLPLGAFSRIRQVLATGLARAGAFDFAFDASGPAYALLAAAARLRSRLERCPYGDQAHFFPRAVFFGLGGYAEIPLMEDVELMRRVRRRKLELCILPDRVATSARRYRREGLLRCCLRNVCLRAAFALGADPVRLALWYRAENRDDAEG